VTSREKGGLMRTILRAEPSYGRVLEVRDWVNHVVIEVVNKPRLVNPNMHWYAETFSGTWEVGWVLRDPVRVAAWPDGGEPLPKPLALLEAVYANVESVYGGQRVNRYMNPMHPATTVATNPDAEPCSLVELVGGSARRSYGGRARTEAKLIACWENLKDHNQSKINRAEARMERMQALRDDGWTYAKIAAEEGITPKAVERAFYRARHPRPEVRDLRWDIEPPRSQPYVPETFMEPWTEWDGSQPWEGWR
jgi:hypothetical protein